jgi:hypothetical protein
MGWNGNGNWMGDTSGSAELLIRAEKLWRTQHLCGAAVLLDNLHIGRLMSQLYNTYLICVYLQPRASYTSGDVTHNLHIEALQLACYIHY